PSTQSFPSRAAPGRDGPAAAGAATPRRGASNPRRLRARPARWRRGTSSRSAHREPRCVGVGAPLRRRGLVDVGAGLGARLQPADRAAGPSRPRGGGSGALARSWALATLARRAGRWIRDDLVAPRFRGIRLGSRGMAKNEQPAEIVREYGP